MEHSNIKRSTLLALLQHPSQLAIQNQTIYLTGDDPVSIITDDFNNDAKLDLVVVNSHDDSVSVLFSNGNGTVQSQKRYNFCLVKFK